MVAATFSIQSSLLDLARAGDFSALGYWINRVLIPDGFYAHVDGYGVQGCVNICVECPAPRTAEQTDLQANIIRRICHQLWQLNSTVIHGVKVSGSVPGRAEILWQQTVRIVTPANQRVTWRGEKLDWETIARPVLDSLASLRLWIRSRYKVLRLLLLAGSAAAAFTLGSWFSVHSTLNWIDQHPPHSSQTPSGILDTRPGAEMPSMMPDMMSNTVSRSGASSTSKVSGLARIQSILNELARSSVTSIAPPPQRQHSKDVVLLIGGDVSFDGPLAGDNAAAFTQLGALAAADVTAVNLESPLSQVDRAEAQFQATQSNDSPVSPSQSEASSEASSEAKPLHSHNVRSASSSGAIAALNRAGVDVVNLANGGIMEDGERGLKVTLQQLDQAEIATLGAGRTREEAARAQIVEVKGVKIAYLGYATADYTIAQDHRSGINEALRQQIDADIVALRDRVDWIIVNYHWGDNAASYPAHWQTQLARKTIDAGADAVIGHNPNVLQGAETYAGRPIVYSLGQLLYGDKYGFGGETALLRLRLEGETISADFVPIEIWDGRPVAASEASAGWIMQRIEDLSQGFDRPLANLAQSVDGLSDSEQRISEARHRAARQPEPEVEAFDQLEPLEHFDPDPFDPMETASATKDAAPAVPTVETFKNTASITATETLPTPTQIPPSIAPVISSEPSSAIAADIVAMKLTRQSLPPLSGRTITEQSLEQFTGSNPQFQQFQPGSAPSSTSSSFSSEVDLDFQHPSIQQSRRNLADELNALDLQFDPAALSSPLPSPSSQIPTRSPVESQASQASQASQPPHPKLQLPELPKTIAPTAPQVDPFGEAAIDRVHLDPLDSPEDHELEADSPFSREPIITLPQPLSPLPTPETRSPQVHAPLTNLNAIGQAIVGQWNAPTTTPHPPKHTPPHHPLSFTIPGRAVMPSQDGDRVDWPND